MALPSFHRSAGDWGGGEALGKVSASKSALVEGLALAGPVAHFFNGVGKSGDFVLAKFQSQSESAAMTGTL